MQEEQILCACSAYEQKYYLNPRYASLPSAIQDELQIMAVTMTEDVGGVFTMEFDEDGSLYMSTTQRKMISSMRNRKPFEKQTIPCKIRRTFRKFRDLL